MPTTIPPSKTTKKPPDGRKTRTKKGGRPSKYTPELAAKVMEALRLGATYELAANYAGIAATTLYEWKKKFSEFSESCDKASGQMAVVSLARLQRSAKRGNTRADMWLLERRFPGQYGRRPLSFADGEGNESNTLTIQAQVNHGFDAASILATKESIDAACHLFELIAGGTDDPGRAGLDSEQ